MVEKLVVQLVKKLMEVKNEMFRQPHDPGSWAWLVDERPYPLASLIIHALGASSVEERDVIYLIAMSIISEMKKGEDQVLQLAADPLIRRTIERLQTPEDYEFHVPISARNDSNFTLDIGGTHKLKIESLANRGRPRMVFSGRVNAIHEYHSSRQIEADVKSLIGLSISMGMAELFPSGPVYEMPVIEFLNKTIKVPFDPTIGGLVSRTRLALPNDLDELETRRLAGRDASAGLERRLRVLTNILSSTSERGEELRTASVLLFDAFATLEPGMAIAIAFMSMEAVLLDPKAKESILARLSEAVAYRLGKSSDDRTRLRKRIKELYQARCDFVHTGRVREPSTVVNEARDIAADVLRREIFDLDADSES